MYVPARIEAPVDVGVGSGLEHLRHEFSQDQLLGEVLRSDNDVVGAGHARCAKKTQAGEKGAAIDLHISDAVAPETFRRPPATCRPQAP